jgi:hypothetical protein
MPANVTVNDFRWQFIAGDKYWVIGTIRFSGNYTAGGTQLLFTDPRNPMPTSAATVKASRAPWFALIAPAANGSQFIYQSPSQLQTPPLDPPNTVGTVGRQNATTFVSEPSDINDGKLLVFSAAGVEYAGPMGAFPLVTGLFIFQGME